jgi:hypothetical protein
MSRCRFFKPTLVSGGVFPPAHGLECVVSVSSYPRKFPQKVMKSISRSFARLFFDRSPIPHCCGNVRHVVVIRWDAKLGDSIVSSFFYREVKRLTGATVTVLTVESLADLHQNDFGADRVIVTSRHPEIPELLRIWRQLGRVDAVLHLVELIQRKRPTAPSNQTQ